jgi:hypothetical protein
VGVVNYDGEGKVGVDEGAKGIIEGSRNKRRLYVVFAVRRKIEDKRKKWRKQRRLLTGSYLQVGDLLEILWQVRQLKRKKEGSTTTGLLLFCKSFKLII